MQGMGQGHQGQDGFRAWEYPPEQHRDSRCEICHITTLCRMLHISRPSVVCCTSHDPLSCATSDTAQAQSQPEERELDESKPGPSAARGEALKCPHPN